MNNDSSNFKVNPDGSPANKLEVEIKGIEPARTAKPDEIPVVDISCLLTENKNKTRSTADQVSLRTHRLFLHRQPWCIAEGCGRCIQGIKEKKAAFDKAAKPYMCSAYSMALASLTHDILEASTPGNHFF